MKKLVLFFFFLIPAFTFAQINLPTGGKLPKTPKVPKVPNELSKAIDEKLKSQRAEYDEATFNYAISFSDNAGLFETKERWKRHRNNLLDGQKVSLDKKVKMTPEQRARTANNTGEMMYANNRFKAAEASFKTAKKTLDNNNRTSSDEYGLVLNNMGLLYNTTGRYTKSEEFTKLALEHREKYAKNKAAHASSLNNLGVLYKDLGRYNESESLLNQALEMNAATGGKTSLPYALSLNNKAMLFQAIGRYDKAEAIMLEALEIAGTHLKDKSSNFVKLKVNQALLLMDAGKLEESEAAYLEAIRLKEKRMGKGHPDYAHLKRGLASLYLVMGKNDLVEENLLTAVKIYEKKFKAEHPSYAAAIHDLGNFYRISGRETEAGPYLEQCVNIREKLLGKSHPDYIESLEALALQHWQLGQTDKAKTEFKQVMSTSMEFLETYFAPMSEQEKSKFWAKLQPRVQRFYNFATANPDQHGEMYNLQLNTKALLLNSSNRIRNAILGSDDTKLVEKYLSWLDKKEELARLYTLSKEELAEEEVDLAAMEADANKLEKELSAESHVFDEGYGNKASVNWINVMHELGGEEAAVEIIQYQHYDKVFTDKVEYAAVVIKKGAETPEFVHFDNGSELEGNAIQSYRDGVYELADTKSTYDFFWKSIDPKVKDFKKIYVSLDGVFNLIALNTLRAADNTYLIDRHELVLVGNTREVIDLKKNPSVATTKTAELYGYPKYGDLGKVSDLPGTKREVENIDVILKNGGYTTDVYMSVEASEEQIKKANPGILHIATHGFFLPDVSRVKRSKVLGIETSKAAENPLHRSGLLLAYAEATMYGDGGDHSSSNNGILTAYETMNLNLSKTELVVLSACETGLGDIKVGEGVYGLQRSFQVAGAHSLIMSLWQVSDEATMELMTHFYSFLSESGNKRDAFRKAQLKVKEKYPEPFYWGAFVLIGN